jgi:hypothetical protein
MGGVVAAGICTCIVLDVQASPLHLWAIGASNSTSCPGEKVSGLSTAV